MTNRDSLYQVTVTPESSSVLYDGTVHQVAQEIEQVFTVDGHTYTVFGLIAQTSQRDAGKYRISITGQAVVVDEEENDVTDQFAVTLGEAYLTVLPRSVVLTSSSASKVYDGTGLTTLSMPQSGITVSGDGFAEGDWAEYQVTGRQLLPGESVNSFTYSLPEHVKAGNYLISVNPGTLTVLSRSQNEKIPFRIQAVSAAALYDGAAHTAEGFLSDTITYNSQTFRVEGITASAAATDAGTYETIITGTPVVRDSMGQDVTAQFDVTVIPGQLVINPRTISLTSASGEKEYDGNAFTLESVTVDGDGFAENEGAAYAFSGTQLLPDSSQNLFTYQLDAGPNPANYRITQNFGTLKVKDRSIPYEIQILTARSIRRQVSAAAASSWTASATASRVSEPKDRAPMRAPIPLPSPERLWCWMPRARM